MYLCHRFNNKIGKMKKLFLMAFVFVGLTANAVEKNESVSLSDADFATLAVGDEEEINDGGIKVAKGKDDDDCLSMHLYVGGNIPTGTPDGVDFSYWRSLDINLTVIQYDYRPKNSKVCLSAGLGFGWREYPLDGHKHMFYKKDNIVSVGPADANMDNLRSDIHTTSLTMPLLAKYSFSKNFAVSLGAQLNWNFYGRVGNSYKIGDNDYDVNTRKIGQRPFTVDVMGIIHVWKIGFYCKYSPMSVFKKDKGPDFKSLSVGFYF